MVEPGRRFTRRVGVGREKSTRPGVDPVLELASTPQTDEVGLSNPPRSPLRQRRSRRTKRGYMLDVSIGLAIIVLTLLLIGFALHHNLRAIDQLVEQLINVEEPTSVAAQEMEINVLGTSLAVWKYLATGAPEHRDRVEKDKADYRRFRAEYDRLTSMAVERELGHQLDALYEPFVRLGDSLMDTRDEHVGRIGSVADAFDEIDRILDDRIQPGIDLDSFEGMAKLLWTTAIEADVAEVGAWLGIYVADPTERNQDRVMESMLEARTQLAGFRKLELTAEELRHAARIEQGFDTAVTEVERAVALHTALRGDQSSFITMRNQLDDLLDEGIQVLARRDLVATEPEARSAIDRLYAASVIILLLGAAVCIAAAGRLAYRSRQLDSANQELRDEIARRERSETARTLLHAELVSVEEKERGRLARELHDQMGQNLSTLLLGLKGLSRTESNESWAAAVGPELRNLQELTGQLIEQVHTIAWELRPAALDELGVHGALTSYLEDWTLRSRVKVDFESNLEGQSLPGPVALAFYRVAQEALINVMKHADARNVSLTLQRHGSEIVMVVEDDGRGFDADVVLAASSPGEHVGVLGMRERTALAGGAFELESTPGSGTTLVVRIPVIEVP